MTETPDPIIEDTQRWLERAVIGLNLCPFAKAVHQKRQIRYTHSRATTVDALAAALAHELQLLAAADPALTDTTLLIHPQVLQDFDAYNDFLDVADAVVAELGLEGEIQVASFHPRFRFEGSDEDDVTNCSNRSPYPTLHLLREDSVERALESFPEAETIFERNIETLRALGPEGWERVLAGEPPAG